MKCTNCGLPLSPSRTTPNCPRCGAPINTGQGVQQQPFDQGGWGNVGGVQQQPFDQGSWGNMGGVQPQQSPWSQTASTAGQNQFPQQDFPNQGLPGAMRAPGFNSTGRAGLEQTNLPPRRPYEQQQPRKRKNTQIMFLIAGLCVLLAALLLVFIAVLGSSNSNNPAPNTANTGVTPTSAPQNTVTPTTTTDVTPTVDPATTPTVGAGSPTTGPASQYIDGVQMGTDIDNGTLQVKNPTTTFKAGSNMYVSFKLHPPSAGGAYCASWYLNGTKIAGTDYSHVVKATSTGSYTYAMFGSGSSGSAYVELSWASDTTCADKQLAQHFDFTVTA